MYDITPNAPCKGCPDRKIGCHGKCEKYLSWRVEYENYKKKICKVRSEIIALDSRKWRTKK